MCTSSDEFEKTILKNKKRGNSSKTWKDEVSSWWCGKNVYFQSCDSEYSCDYFTVGSGDKRQSSAGNIMKSESGHENRIEVIRMKKYQPTDAAATTLFKNSNCTSDSAAFYIQYNEN